MLAAGSVFTNSGIPIRGQYDERTGDAFAAENELIVRFRLVSPLAHRIVACLRPECRKEFIVHGYPPEVVYPISIPTIEVAPEIPDSVRRAFLEAKRAHAEELDIASLLAARTALTRMQREQNCEGIDDLAEKGVITRFLAQQAHEIRLWANLFRSRRSGPRHTCCA
jgi:hypothetical protein